MKTIPLLVLVGLVVFVTSAQASENQTEPNLVVLPAYVVTASRHLEIVQRINASLNELRQQANVPVVELADLSSTAALKAPIIQAGSAPQSGKSIRVAKL